MSLVQNVQAVQNVWNYLNGMESSMRTDPLPANEGAGVSAVNLVNNPD